MRPYGQTPELDRRDSFAGAASWADRRAQRHSERQRVRQSLNAEGTAFRYLDTDVLLRYRDGGEDAAATDDDREVIVVVVVGGSETDREALRADSDFAAQADAALRDEWRLPPFGEEYDGNALTSPYPARVEFANE